MTTATTSLPLPLTRNDRAYLARVNASARVRAQAEERALRLRGDADRWPGDARMLALAVDAEAAVRALYL